MPKASAISPIIATIRSRRPTAYFSRNRLLARQFHVSKDRTIAYARIVPEVATEPNYDATLAAPQEAGLDAGFDDGGANLHRVADGNLANIGDAVMVGST